MNLTYNLKNSSTVFAINSVLKAKVIYITLKPIIEIKNALNKKSFVKLIL